MKKTIAVLATMDTKGAEASFLKKEIEKLGAQAMLIDIGVIDDATIDVDKSNADVARSAGHSIEQLRDVRTRQHAAPIMAKGATTLIQQAIATGELHAVLGLGGTQGTSLCADIMQALPYGFPKLILSTVASGDTSPFVGIKDVTMMFAVSDILGLNPFSRAILANAAGAAFGMARNARTIEPEADSRGTIAMTNLGVLTDGARHAIDRFHEAGYEVITFHAIGAGGMAMEQMMREGLVDGVFDYALGEIADWVFDGLRAADEHRLTVAGELGIPQVICPGGAEHIGLLLQTPNEVPPKYAGHKHVFHSPVVFAPRLNNDEIVQVAHEITRRLAKSHDKTVFMIPRHGVSRYSIDQGPLEDHNGDEVFFDALRTTMPAAIKIIELDHGAEDPAFVDQAVQNLLQLMEH